MAELKTALIDFLTLRVILSLNFGKIEIENILKLNTMGLIKLFLYATTNKNANMRNLLKIEKIELCKTTKKFVMNNNLYKVHRE